MAEKPALYLKSALARLIGTDPRVVGVRDMEPVAYLISATGRRLPLFSAIKQHTEKTNTNANTI
ncbi:MAG TPA: hypothetical protein VNY04_02870 [Chthoniobacterales bacterium]|jgi:hypothetical protein|nr:hypothetical protein [Chthoniobacterales bacterium]